MSYSLKYEPSESFLSSGIAVSGSFGSIEDFAFFLGTFNLPNILFFYGKSGLTLSFVLTLGNGSF